MNGLALTLFVTRRGFVSALRRDPVPNEIADCNRPARSETTPVSKQPIKPHEGERRTNEEGMGGQGKMPGGRLIIAAAGVGPVVLALWELASDRAPDGHRPSRECENPQMEDARPLPASTRGAPGPTFEWPG